MALGLSIVIRMEDEVMGESDKEDALAVGRKIQAQYFQQSGQMLDLRDLEVAVSTGHWTAVNREVIRLTIKAASMPNTLN